MIILGIDPGLTGAMVLYDSGKDKVLDVYDLPVRGRDYGKGKQIDSRMLFYRINALKQKHRVNIAAIENVGPMPKQGPTSSFSFGCSVCSIRTVLDILDLRVIPVHATSWKSRFGLIGKTKKDTVNMIKECYPETVPFLRLQEYSDRADAVAITVCAADYL